MGLIRFWPLCHLCSYCHASCWTQGFFLLQKLMLVCAFVLFLIWFHNRYNNYDRSVINTVPHNLVQRWYVAHRQLTTILRRPENELWLKLTPGKVGTLIDLLMIDPFWLHLYANQTQVILKLPNHWKSTLHTLIFLRFCTFLSLTGHFHRQLACPAREGGFYWIEAAVWLLSHQRWCAQHCTLLRSSSLSFYL